MNIWMGLAVSIVICFAAAGIGAFFRPGAWYESIDKPSWTPPGALFPLVWTLLYLMMAVAAWLVWKIEGFTYGHFALTLFGVQLLLNALWTAIFFGWKKPGLAFLDIVLLWCAISLTILSFWAFTKIAALLMVPYLVWVTFAAALNFSIWRRNR